QLEEAVEQLDRDRGGTLAVVTVDGRRDAESRALERGPLQRAGGNDDPGVAQRQRWSVARVGPARGPDHRAGSQPCEGPRRLSGLWIGERGTPYHEPQPPRRPAPANLRRGSALAPEPCSVGPMPAARDLRELTTRIRRQLRLDAADLVDFAAELI